MHRVKLPLVLLAMLAPLLFAPLPAQAAVPFYVYAPWTAGVTMTVGTPGNFYGQGGHVGSDYYAVDINGLGGGNTDCGQPIRATSAGKVIAAVHGTTGYGNYVLIDHGSGYTSRYAHLQSIVVSVGETVVHGEVVGYMGDTGNSTACHLHFVIYLHGNSVPPSPMSGVALYDGVRIVSNNVPPDLTPPTVRITSPPARTWERGVLTVTATASDASGIKLVSLRIDGGASLGDSAAPYAWSWDTRKAKDGAHTLTATAVDKTGNTASTSIVSYVDNTPPVASITSPDAGTVNVNEQSVAEPTLPGLPAPLPVAPPRLTVAAGDVPFTASASDAASGMSYVSFRVDGVERYRDGVQPYAWTWPAQDASLGSHTLSIVAVDRVGNARTASLAVDVALPTTERGVLATEGHYGPPLPVAVPILPLPELPGDLPPVPALPL